MEINFPKLEEKILRFWKKNRIFEKSIEKRKKDFIFYEGPPTANARPGLHHVLSRVYKDIICRYKTMRGFRVLRKAGWDTHGLPVELEIEKKIGTKTKKDIENFGIEKFNFLCKKSVWEYKKDWEKLTERIGFWLDLKNPYITYEPEYIESVWFLLKRIWEKGLLYEDFKVSPYCPRCQTILSSHEVAQGYKKIKEPAIYVKFKVLNSEYKNCFLLVWTTTPWTLPGNVAIAVNPNFDYLFLEKGGEVFILAKERAKALNIEGKILKETKGKNLIGLRYQPVFDFYQPDFEKEKIWEVLGANFVLLEEGTGLVHIAPAFGEEDMELIKTQNSKLKTQNQKKFPIILNVDEEGKFKLEVKKFAGLFVKDADPLIIQDLKERGFLFKEEIYEHDYPFCWRCKSPLLYYAKKSWFIKMTAVKEKLIKNNQNINWIPAHLKEGRFGEWLKEVKDWALSRERYWGTPLPIWKCQNCGSLEVIGSREDLRKKKFSKNNYFILRHGEALSNVKNLNSCWPEKFKNPLTKKGKEQIEKLAKELKEKGPKIDIIFSSDLLRTKQTAEILAKNLKVKVIFDKRLREYNVGKLNGRKIEEVGRFWDPEGKLPRIEYYLRRFKVRAPGGENYYQVKKRMYKFLLEVDRKFEGKNILIISHEAPLTLLEGAVEGFTPKEIIIFRDKKKLNPGEMRKLVLKIFPYNKNGELDFHRPFIDKVKFFCPKCNGEMKRVPEVIDCWFDSGAMPFAQYHWPFENGKKPKLFPADYIAEGVDQTRGWFYTLLAISTLMGLGPAYKNVISLGHVLDEKGEKMSKSKGNVVDPWYIIKKYGADCTRWYFFTINQPGDSKLFSERDLEETYKRFILNYFNCFQFFNLYAKKNVDFEKIPKLENVLDEWIISRLHNLILKVTKFLDEYQVTQAAREIENFVTKDLSRFYIRLERESFHSKEKLKKCSQILGYLLLNLAKLTAPFLPFLSELIFLKINRKGSVHLEDWPKVERKRIKKEVEKEMEIVREIISLALAERKKNKIKVRQPLQRLVIQKKLKKEFLDIIAKEVNVKEVVLGKEFFLDTKITPDLKEEGIKREFIRQIQFLRKKEGLKKGEKIAVYYFAPEEISQILKKNEKEILERAKIKTLKQKESKENLTKKVEIDGNFVLLEIEKIGKNVQKNKN